MKNPANLSTSVGVGAINELKYHSVSDALSDFWDGFKHFWQHLFEVWWLALLVIITIIIVLFICFCCYGKLRVYRSDIRARTDKYSKFDLKIGKKNLD